MIKPPIPENENERLEALISYNILDTLPENDFEEITFIASEICQTPISLISLIDRNRQWFKSNRGLNVTETSRDLAFCAHAILEPEEVLVVTDALSDDRFADNPLVQGQPDVVFYTGVPLVNPDGYALGTLCVIDNKPKELTANQIIALKALAKQVVAQLELRKKVKELDIVGAELVKSNEYLERFAVMAAHDIRNPLTSILLAGQILKDRFKGNPDEKGNKFVDIINHSSQRLLAMLDKMLDYSKSNKILSQNKEEADMLYLLEEAIKLIEIPDYFTVKLPVSAPITTSVVAFEQVIINLLSNAIRYNNKPRGLIKIEYREDDQFYIFTITDNGIGISQAHYEKIFNPMFTVGHTDRFDKKGSGVGLSTVKNLVEALGGTISVNSVIDEFTAFTFTLKKEL
ncbi:ATP-binding protein [Mucilaginibacter angelicae]|uniref:histidine kinase n=1 Tax=Mucilaginibacter angelicae TaxID=869718 RepID=A0ABV6LD91_9SPHI